MTFGISFPLNFHCQCDDDEESIRSLQLSSFFLASMFHIFIKQNLPYSPPVVFPATRWLSLRLFTSSFNLNICVYDSCYCTIMDILQCRFTYHTRCASQQQFDSSKMCSVCFRLSRLCMGFQLNRQFVAAFNSKSWENKLNETLYGFEFGIGAFSSKDQHPTHDGFLANQNIRFLSIHCVFKSLTICFSTANKERKLAWFSIFTRQARYEWTFQNNKYSSQRHIFSDIASKHTATTPAHSI